MNELSEIIKNAKSGDTITLESGKIYSISPENSFHKFGLYFSNTAKADENPNGERFCGIYLENKENIVIDGNGACVLIHGIMTPFIFKNCKNIILKNLTLDHYRPTMTEYTIIDSAPGTAMLKINSDYLYRIEDNKIIWISENDESGKPYWEIPYKGDKVLSNALDPDTHILVDMISGVNERRGFPDIEGITEIEKGLLSVTLRDKTRHIKKGTIVSTRCIVRSQTGGAIDESENVTLSNLRIKSMNCFGILAQNSKDVTYDSLDLTPPPGRTIVSDADFFHFSGCMGKMTVTNCKASGAHDDIINIHGTHLKVISLNHETSSAVLRYIHPETWGFNAYKEGDNIEFINGNTLLPYFSATVTKSEKLNDTDVLISLNALPTCELGNNDVVENITRTAELYVSSNTFAYIPSRAILCTTRKKAIITNNTFENMGAPALCVADDANFWFESGHSTDIEFTNNTIINCGGRETKTGTDIIRYEPVVLDKGSNTPVHKSLIFKDNNIINTLSDFVTIKLNHLKSAQLCNNTCNTEIKYVTNAVTFVTKQ